MTTMLSGSGATTTESKEMLPLSETCDRCVSHANVTATIGDLDLLFCRHHYGESRVSLHEQASAIVLHPVRAD